MEIKQKHDIIAEFLTSAPLYKKIDIDYRYYSSEEIEKVKFRFYCPNEKNIQTFSLNLEPIKIIEDRKSGFRLDNHLIPSEAFESASIMTLYYSGTCQYCKKYQVHYLLQVEADGKLDVIQTMGNRDFHIQNLTLPKITLKKIGQFPPFEIKPDKDLMSFLNSEDQDNYKKSLICLSQSYGIGAFAYLRRILENEIIRIIEDLSKLERPESEGIQKLLKAFKENHQMANLIEGVYQYLPNSLKSLDSNPLKVLYGQLSGGIHEFSEEECLKKAEHIDKLLKFVIKRINEENSEVKAAREAIKSLI